MRSSVDAGRIFKQPVLCFKCEDSFYFTLRAIADDRKLVCPHCGGDINLANDVYRPLVATVIATLKAINP
jgi:hypothetical protein